MICVPCLSLVPLVILAKQSLSLSLTLNHKAPACISAAAAKLLQSCLTLCDPMDGSPSGSRIPAMLQARILEWVAISFSNA